MPDQVTSTPQEADAVALGVMEHMARAWAREARGSGGLQVLGEELERLLPCDRAYLLRVNVPTEEMLVVAVHGSGRHRLRPGQRLAPDDHVVELLEGSLDVLVCSDTRLWASGLERRLAEEGLHSCVAMVLRWQSRPLGVLLVASERPLAYGPAELRVLRQMAPALGAHLWKTRRPAPPPSGEQAPGEERERVLLAVVGGLTHHFNNVMAYLLGSLELMGEGPLGGEARELCARMEERVIQASQTLRSLQRYAAEDPPERLEEIDLAGLAEEVLELTRPVWETTMRAAGRAVEVCHLPEPGLTVRGNRRDLREALVNVLFNALQALPAGGRIWISEGREKIWNYLEIADEGEGMSDEVLRRAREPFFTTRPGPHQGLGLSVTAGIVRRHGGDVSLSSSPGQGAVVRLNLLASRQGE